MAKAKKVSKTTSKIKELKGIKETNITEEQLTRLQATVSHMNQMQTTLGVMETRKHRLLHEIGSVQDGLTNLQNEFMEQYGSIDINIQTGEINYGDEQVDS